MEILIDIPINRNIFLDLEDTVFWMIRPTTKVSIAELISKNKNI
jgi:hypothetical protein